ncbi:hypothetical protein SEA_SHAM4_68 [Mycobacterium phage Sham4]|uniref:hypothetical protein n=1 Tax=Mycobacterium phage Mulciber TaxID=1805459 RepID=UPI00078C9EC6|nr:hypothetical protein BJD74_gp41 [Mycobacterium phage Mulciber]ASR86705.1 hypothetical protein SEA_ET2BRUTUS_67 [Mycobacterium phage Et2Brutus]AXC33427.1 hypothetical protein SEA_EBONY_68 [Mycobacterium phage Ebony]AXH50747.1 hypothetical protein SEA_SNAPE_68 [Mycobacterium phage Snape]QBI97896.1 hypothetical protein SEA_ORANGE_67 [Mycobacterium phage Orange]QBI98237.1 hypothetical protein SEA_BOWTIE_69 [Mycobacterium phage Bowtie]QBI98437.1 hypothetical protein SEA_MUNCH_68 [Mycobacterium 
MKEVDGLVKQAGELQGKHLGKTVRFDWNFPNGVRAYVVGQLNEVSHKNHQTTLWLVKDKASPEAVKFSIPSGRNVVIAEENSVVYR